MKSSSFDVRTDNQDLNTFFSNPNLSKQETRYIEVLGQFGILKWPLLNENNMC